MRRGISSNSDIGTVAVKEGIGDSTVSIHPDVATEKIRKQGDINVVGPSQMHSPPAKPLLSSTILQKSLKSL